VGRPLSDADDPSRWNGNTHDRMVAYLGPKGLTGLVQINTGKVLDAEEIERYKLYYAKNYSLGLDVQIIFKSLVILAKS
jgi:lipopolysaccharide/colanic/teichoic acid biosynthesis glycosyltransferase